MSSGHFSGERGPEPSEREGRVRRFRAVECQPHLRHRRHARWQAGIDPSGYTGNMLTGTLRGVKYWNGCGETQIMLLQS